MAANDIKVKLTIDTRELTAALDRLAAAGAEAERGVRRVGVTLRDMFAANASSADDCPCRRDFSTGVLSLNPDCPRHGRRVRGLGPEAFEGRDQAERWEAARERVEAERLAERLLAERVAAATERQVFAGVTGSEYANRVLVRQGQRVWIAEDALEVAAVGVQELVVEVPADVDTSAVAAIAEAELVRRVRLRVTYDPARAMTSDGVTDKERANLSTVAARLRAAAEKFRAGLPAYVRPDPDWSNDPEEAAADDAYAVREYGAEPWRRPKRHIEVDE